MPCAARWRGFPEVAQYRVVHDAAGIHVELVVRPAPRRTRADRVAAALREAMRNLGADVAVDAAPVDRIERAAGPAGKLKLVESRT